MSITREEIRQLCIAHDRFMAEQASETIRRSPVSESGGAGIIYKEYDNSALPPAAATAEGEQDWSGWEAWMAGHLAVEREHMLDSLAEAMGICLAETRKEMRAERAAEIAPLKTEIAELRGQVSALLTMLGAGDKAKDASIIALPNWRKRTDAA